MEKITKQDLSNVLANYTNTKKDAGEALNALIAEIKKSLQEGSSVIITGFGTFSVVDRAAREGRNPATGEAIQISARKIVKFKVGKTLKDSVN